MSTENLYSAVASQCTVEADLTVSVQLNEDGKRAAGRGNFFDAMKSPSNFSASGAETCRICLQSKAEVDGGLCGFLRAVTCGGTPNALFQLECSCSVGTVGFMCFHCLQTFESRQGRLCDLCKRPLFPDSGPDLLLALLHGSRYLTLASLLSLLLMTLSACLRPELVKSMSGSQPLLPAACVGLLILSVALFALFARQFRAGVCPPCRRYRAAPSGQGDADHVERQLGTAEL